MILPVQVRLIPAQMVKIQTMRTTPRLANSFFPKATKKWFFPLYPSTSATNQRRITMMSRSTLSEEKVTTLISPDYI